MKKKTFIIITLFTVCISNTLAMTHGEPVNADNQKHKSAVRLMDCSATKISEHHFLLAAHCLGPLKEKLYKKEKKLFYINEKTTEIEEVSVNVKRFFLPKDLGLYTIPFWVPEPKDIAIVEIKEESSYIPPLQLRRNPIINKTESLNFTCFGINEVTTSSTEKVFYNPRYGEQSISSFDKTSIQVLKTKSNQNFLLAGDSGCGIYNSNNALIAIHTHSVTPQWDFFLFEVSYEEKTFNLNLLIAPYFDWIENVIDGKSLGFILNLDQSKFIREN